MTFRLLLNEMHLKSYLNTIYCPLPIKLELNLALKTTELSFDTFSDMGSMTSFGKCTLCNLYYLARLFEG